MTTAPSAQISWVNMATPNLDTTVDILCYNEPRRKKRHEIARGNENYLFNWTSHPPADYSDCAQDCRTDTTQQNNCHGRRMPLLPIGTYQWHRGRGTECLGMSLHQVLWRLYSNRKCSCEEMMLLTRLSSDLVLSRGWQTGSLGLIPVGYSCE